MYLNDTSGVNVQKKECLEEVREQRTVQIKLKPVADVELSVSAASGPDASQASRGNQVDASSSSFVNTDASCTVTMDQKVSVYYNYYNGEAIVVLVIAV